MKRELTQMQSNHVSLRSSLLAPALYVVIGVWSVISLPSFVVAGDLWPGWLGSERNGWVADFEAPAIWPNSLTKVWSVEVGTAGQSHVGFVTSA